MNMQFEETLLVNFALWIGPTWDEDNSDDIASARRCVSEFLEERNRQKPVPIGPDRMCAHNCASPCPLGRRGMEMRCTEDELVKAGIPVERCYPQDKPPDPDIVAGVY